MANNDKLSELLGKYSFHKTMRVTAWIMRFLHNLAKGGEKKSGPLSTQEIERVTHFWIKRVQEENDSTNNLESDKGKLNLVKNENGILVCKG